MREQIRNLVEILRERSYREGDFTLASGRKSKFYIDVKTTSLWPEGADEIGRLAVQEIAAAGLGRIHALAGLTLGADPILTAVSLAGLRAGHRWPALIVRKEPKKHGTEKYIEGIENVARGASVLILEDVVTSGESGLLAAKRCREAGYTPVGILAVVDREEGGRQAIEGQGLKLWSLVKLTDLRA